MAERAHPERGRDIVDETIDDSFPASDPPSWTSGPSRPAQPVPHVGSPVGSPIGSIDKPLEPPLRGTTGPASTPLCAPTIRERLVEEGPLVASGALAVGSLLLMLTGKRRTAGWLMGASTWLLLLGTYRRLGGRPSRI
jgi:hypothetical protein